MYLLLFESKPFVDDVGLLLADLLFLAASYFLEYCKGFLSEYILQSPSRMI